MQFKDDWANVDPVTLFALAGSALSVASTLFLLVVGWRIMRALQGIEASIREVAEGRSGDAAT